MGAKFPLCHWNLENGEDDHQISRILFAVKVGDKSGQEIMVIFMD